MHLSSQELNAWPTELQTLLLKAALLQGPTALAAWQTWKSRIDLERDGLDAASYRLLPLLYHNLQVQAVDDPLMEKLKDVHRAAWFKNRMLFHSVADVLQALQAAGIKTLIHKGAALTLAYYGDYGLRPMADFDVLVPTEKRAAAFEVLAAAGWKPEHLPLDELTPDFLDVRHSWGLEDGKGRQLDLHWHLLNDSLYPSADDAFWAAAVPVQVEDVATLTLCPTDHLFQACAHGLKINPLTPLRWIADGMTILSVAGPALNWDRFIEQAHQRRLSLVMFNALAYLSETLGASIPAEVLRRLSVFPVSAAERQEYRLRVTSSILWGHLPLAWSRYLRYQNQKDPSISPLRLWLGFPNYLRLVRKNRNLLQVGLWAVSKGVKRLWRTLIHRPLHPQF